MWTIHAAECGHQIRDEAGRVIARDVPTLLEARPMAAAPALLAACEALMRGPDQAPLAAHYETAACASPDDACAGCERLVLARADEQRAIEAAARAAVLVARGGA